MKGGGLTWVGWLMVGVGGMLMYAGMTGQSLVTELGAVLSGKSPKSADTGTVGSGAGSSAAADRQYGIYNRQTYTRNGTVPNPVHAAG